MMSQKESPRNHLWVLTKRVVSSLWVSDSRLVVNDGWFLLLFTRQGRDTTDWEEKMMGDSWVIPSTIPALPCSRKHPSFSSKLNWAEIQTVLSTFLGITQEAPMMIPSVTSLTERSVCFSVLFCHSWNINNILVSVWIQLPKQF